jgi:hypothetical protein
MVLSRGQRGGAMVDRLNPATAIADGEGGRVGKHHHVGVPLGAVGIRSG